MLQRNQKLLLCHLYLSLVMLVNKKHTPRLECHWHLLEVMKCCQVFQVHFPRKSKVVGCMPKRVTAVKCRCFFYLDSARRDSLCLWQ